MPESIDAPTQAIAATEQSRDAILDRIAEAEMSGSSTEDLQAQLAATRTKPAETPEAHEKEVQSESRKEIAQVKGKEFYEGEPLPLEPKTDGDTPQTVEEEAKVHDRLRINHLSEEDKLTANAITLLTRKGLSLAEATQRVMGDINAPAAPVIPGVTQEQEAPPDLKAIETEMTAAKTRLQEIATRRKEIKTEPAPEVYADELASLAIEQGDLLDAVTEARGKLTETRLEHKEATATKQTVEAAKSIARDEIAKQWPDILDQNSTQAMLMRQLTQQICNDPKHEHYELAWSAQDSPRDHAKFVTLMAEEAAKRIPGMTAKSPNAAAIAPKTQAKTAVPQPVPANGSRASAPAAPAKTGKDMIAALDAEIESGNYAGPRRSIAPSGRYIG